MLTGGQKGGKKKVCLMIVLSLDSIPKEKHSIGDQLLRVIVLEHVTSVNHVVTWERIYKIESNIDLVNNIAQFIKEPSITLPLNTV